MKLSKKNNILIPKSCDSSFLVAENNPYQSHHILKDFIRSFLMPTLVGKSLVLFFGLMYSNYPDEGYGYGLTLAVSFTIFMLLLFLWRYRNVEDP